MERLGKGFVPSPAHVRLLVRFRLRPDPVKRREVGKADFHPSAGGVARALSYVLPTVVCILLIFSGINNMQV